MNGSQRNERRSLRVPHLPRLQPYHTARAIRARSDAAILDATFSLARPGASPGKSRGGIA